MAMGKKPATPGKSTTKKPSSPPAYGMGGNPNARSKAKGNAYGPMNAPGRTKSAGSTKATPTTKPPTPKKRTGK